MLPRGSVESWAEPGASPALHLRLGNAGARRRRSNPGIPAPGLPTVLRTGARAAPPGTSKEPLVGARPSLGPALHPPSGLAVRG